MDRANYGYDAPYALVMFSVACAAAGVGAVIFLWQGLPRGAITASIYFLFFLGNATSFWYTTRRGKFIEWERILDRLNLRGDETVLDLGCGAGDREIWFIVFVKSCHWIHILQSSMSQGSFSKAA